jgi:hypothetical protein
MASNPGSKAGLSEGTQRCQSWGDPTWEVGRGHRKKAIKRDKVESSYSKVSLERAVT